MSTEAAITPVSLETAAEQLKAKIHSAFVEILTPEQWTQMIRSELERFTKPRRVRERYDNYDREVPSVLSELCKEAFSAFVKEEIKKVLTSPDFTAVTWNGEVSSFVKEWMSEHASELVQATLRELAGHAAQAVLQNMANRP